MNCFILQAVFTHNDVVIRIFEVKEVAIGYAHRFRSLEEICQNVEGLPNESFGAADTDFIKFQVVTVTNGRPTKIEPIDDFEFNN